MSSDGMMAKYLFEETRYCFVYGQYLAVISVLGMALVERTLAAEFYASGRDDLERGKHLCIATGSEGQRMAEYRGV